MASIDAAHAEAFTTPGLVFAGACSSVIPYVCDQLAMSRLPRASFVLPATATLIGVMVLAQIPSGQDMIGVLLVMFGVAIHKPTAPETPIQGVESTAP
jgi:inner membrane transporter RhtA